MPRLSTTRLREAADVSGEPTFTFYLDSGRTRYQCTMFQACFISPRVCKIIRSDPTADSLHLNIDNFNGQAAIIESLCNGEDVELATGSNRFLLQLATELENHELYTLFEQDTLSKEITLENCIWRLHKKSLLQLDTEEENTFYDLNTFKCAYLLL